MFYFEFGGGELNSRVAHNIFVELNFSLKMGTYLRMPPGMGFVLFVEFSCPVHKRLYS